MILRRNRLDPPGLPMLFDAGTATGLTDGQLLERFATTRGGESAELAFAALVDRHGPMVWRVCRAILRDDHDAEDAFQATFLVLVRRAGSLWVRDSIGPWLHRVARRAAVRARVTAGRRRAAERKAIAMTNRGPDEPVDEEFAGVVHAEIDRLPDRYRMPVVLCDVEGRSYEEAARHLRCPIGTIKSRLARARERLRGRLARHGLAVPAGFSIAATGPGATAAAPIPLVRATIRAAVQLATDGAVEGGVVSGSVVALARGVSMAMFWQPMKGLANVALTIAVAIVGAGLMVRAAVEPRIIAPAAPPQAAPEHPSQPPVKPLVGIVHDPDGKPVAGATVVAGRFAGGEPNHVIGATGPDGRFELTPAGQSAIPDYVIAYKAGLAPASVLRIPRDDRPVEDEVVLQLPRPAPFVGIVKDREGRPVAGAAVLIRDIQYPSADGQQIMLHGVEKIISETPLRRIFHTTSDAQGQFRFTEMPQRAKGSLVVTAAGMGEYHSMNRKWPDGSFGQEGTAAAPAEVILAPAARVVGRIRSRFPSIKVNGLKVGMQGSQKSHGIWRETRIDATGQFEFAGLDEGTANIFLFDHPNDGPWTYRAAADIELKPGRTTEVEIELIRGVQVEGQVVDADSDRPVAGVGVGLYGPIRPRSGAAIISEMTDKDGRYRFRLPPGETLFYVCGPVPTEYGRMSGGGQTVTIPTDVREFTVPRIEIRKEQPAQ